MPKPFERAQMVLRFVSEKAERKIMDKETREMFNMVLEAIGESEERTNRRFDELEKRMDQMATKEELRNMYENLHHEINGVKLHTEALDMRMEYVEKKVDSMDKRLGIVEEKVDAMDKRLDSMDKRLGIVEEKVDSMDKRLGIVEEKVDSMDKRLGTVETKVDSMNKTLQSMIDHEPRIQALENKVFGKRSKKRRELWQP